jgi:2-keto-3-deoxy-L-fuconate dehydrogenase
MSGRLEGKTAFVTAAAQGIGRAIVEAFLSEGARVIAADIQTNKLNELIVRGAKVTVLDVTDAAAVMGVAQAHPEVRVLVNAVGHVASGSVLDGAPGDMQRSFDLNVMSMVNTCRAFLPAMLAAGEGSIVNIASVVSSTRGVPNRFAYGTTKGAVIGLTKSIARDYVGQGVRCNAISPGTVETPSLDERLRAQGDYEAARAAFLARQPMGRLGRAEEIAQAAVLLASDEAPFMTGADLIIDGGMSL